MPKAKSPEVFPHNPDTTPISVGQVWLDHYAKGKGGALCPSCNRAVKYTAFRLNNQLARLLIICYRCYRPGTGINIRALMKACKRNFIKGREWNKLGYWSLVNLIDASGQPTTKPTDLCMLTQKGQDFVYSNLQVVKTVWIREKQLVAADSSTVSIRKVLGKKYDYDFLMNELYEFQE